MDVTRLYFESQNAPATLPRHRHGLDRETVRASQALRILRATAEVVASKGYAATTVAAIVAAAGVSTKTFYDLYKDKEEAFLAAYAAIDVVITAMTAAADTADDDPRGRIRAGIRAYLEILAREPAITRMLVIEAVGGGPRVLARRAKAFDDLVAFLRTNLGGHPPEDAILLALLGGINELTLQHVLKDGAESLPVLQPTIDDLVMRVCFP